MQRARETGRSEGQVKESNLTYLKMRGLAIHYSLPSALLHTPPSRQQVASRSQNYLSTQ